MTERETEIAAEFISDSLFRVTNMTGIDFLNSERKLVSITNPFRRLDDITYFNFRANINPHLVDTRAPDSVHLFEFSLRLSYTLSSSSASLFLRNSILNNNIHASVDNFDSTLSKCLTTIYRLFRHLKCCNYFRLDVIIFPHQVLQTYL